MRLAGALAARGHAVQVVTPDLGDERVEVPPDVEVMRFPFRHEMAGNAPLSPYAMGNPFFYARFARHALDAARQMEASVVHAQNVYSMPAAAIVQMRAGIPAVTTVRDYRMLCPMATCLMEGDGLETGCGFGRYRQCMKEFVALYGGLGGTWPRAKFRLRHGWEWFDLKLRRRYFETLAGAVFVSDRIRGIFEGAGLRAGSHETIPNLPPEKEAPHPDPDSVVDRYGLAGRRIVLAVGRVSIGKGGALLSDLARRLDAAGPDVVVVAAGRVEMPGAFDDAADRIRLLGQVSREDLSALYERAEVFVAPSLWEEPLSRAILEAMHHALPVVAADAGGNPEIVDSGVTGWTVPRNDVRAFADAVLGLLCDAAAARAMGERGRARLEHAFDPETTLDRLEAFYSKRAGAR